MQKKDLIISLYKLGCIQFGSFQLKSGEKTPVYINLRKIISWPDFLRQIADLIWATVKDYKFDLICGVPYAALPVAVCLSLQQRIPLIMRRKERKDYGTRQMIEGEYTDGQSCLIIEDVITSGSSIIETAQDLEQHHLKVTDVVAVIDRAQGGKEILEKKFRTHILLTLPDILQTLLSANLLTLQEKEWAQQFTNAGKL